MLTEKEVAELRNQWSMYGWSALNVETTLGLMDTLEALFKVQKAAQYLMTQLGVPPDPIVDLALAGNLRKSLLPFQEPRESEGK